jgi:hypothetical protein
MATPKTAARHRLVKVLLSDEAYDLLEAFAAEQGIDDLGQAVPALLHELVRLHDQHWDEQFARSTEPLDKKAQEALDAHRAGVTEDFDLDTR